MTLLQHSWSDLLILDFIYHRLTNNLPNEITLPNGQIFNLVDMALLGHNNNVDSLHGLTARFRQLEMDRNDYVCLKFILLLAHGTKRHTNCTLHSNISSISCLSQWHNGLVKIVHIIVWLVLHVLFSHSWFE